MDTAATSLGRHISVEPIKIVIPPQTTLTLGGNVGDLKLTSPTLAHNANLSQQPTVTAKIADNHFVNVKIVSPNLLSAASPRMDEEAENSVPNSSTDVDENTGRESSVSPKKMSRERKQLEESLNSSKVLTEYVIEGRRPRSRRKSISALETGRLRESRSRSRGSELSTTSTFTPKRANMRSANVEFLEKQQKFLQKVHAQVESEGSDDESNDADRWDENKIDPPPKVRHFST